MFYSLRLLDFAISFLGRCPLLAEVYALSKVFERLVLKQLISYIEELSLLAPSISGFRKGHSTTTTLLGIRDDLLRAMKRGEVSLMVLADYSKAFDTVRFKTVLTKLHTLGFSNEFLTWMVHYLSDRRQFVQIDDKISSIETVLFGVPKGSVLGPFIFNLYVSDLQNHIKCPCYQYADDTTFFVHSKIKDLANGVMELNDAISRLGEYSSESNLAMNESKTKWMLVSTRQKSRAHALQDHYPLISCNGKPLERVTTTKILGVHMDEHLTWSDHITALLTSCYAALAVLRKLRNLAPYHVRKQLVESLVLSKLDYGCVVFYPLPDYQMKRLQRVQTTCASYVVGRYAVLEDLQKFNWLPIIERRDLAMLKVTHKALYDDTWPEYLRLKFRTVSAYNLRSLEAPKLAIPAESGTFQDSAARLFNVLPDKLRHETDYDKFVKFVKNFLRQRAYD